MERRFRRVLSGILAAALLTGSLSAGMLGTNRVPSKVQAAENINNPRVEEDAAMVAGQKATWDCVWFGSYPQTEIVDNAETCGTYGNKYWGSSADYEENAPTYSALQNAYGWDSNGDIILPDGNKYRRIKIADATKVISGNGSYYSWSDPDSYHYFRYDPIKWRVLDREALPPCSWQTRPWMIRNTIQ